MSIQFLFFKKGFRRLLVNKQKRKDYNYCMVKVFQVHAPRRVLLSHGLCSGASGSAQLLLSSLHICAVRGFACSCVYIASSPSCPSWLAVTCLMAMLATLTLSHS